VGSNRSASSIFSAFEHELGLMKKQIRMLREIADSTPVTPREGKFVIDDEARLRQLVELLEKEVRLIECGLPQEVV
jgi:hypothetical protein